MSFKEKVLIALEEIRPYLLRDGGDLQFMGVTDDGIVSIRLTGACHGCSMADMTVKDGIEAFLKDEIPEVKEVVQTF